ncbi:MAG: hypothetical protein CSA34_05285 [Desulfobulbus propionicus]|nr:MAG: hypothetical protein CSA34_05285 [Desulfobulbus propionicus]
MQNRLSGLFVFLLGLLLFFFLIPLQTEEVDYGWLHPDTLPSVAAIVIGAAGLLHCLFPKGEGRLHLRHGMRTLIFLGLGIAGLWGMDVAGFAVAAPVMMLVIMLVVGERRWVWLIAGVILLPAVIWFCIDLLLKRPLP